MLSKPSALTKSSMSRLSRSTTPCMVRKPRARGAHQFLHQELRDAGVVPVVADHDAQLAAAAVGVGGVARVADDFAARAVTRLADVRHVPVIVDVRQIPDQLLVRRVAVLDEAPAPRFRRKLLEECALALFIGGPDRPDDDAAAVGKPALAREMGGVVGHAGRTIVDSGCPRRLTQVKGVRQAGPILAAQ